MTPYTYSRLSATVAHIEIQIGNNRIGHSIDSAHNNVNANDLESLGVTDLDLAELNMSKGQMVSKINSEGAKRSAAHNLILQDFDQNGIKIQEFADIMAENSNTPLLQYLNINHPNHPYVK